MVLEEIALEFDGEPVVDRKMGTLADETRERTVRLASLLSSGRKRRLPEPSADFVAGLRDAVSQAYIRMGWMEPEDDEPGRRTYGRQARSKAR